MSTPDEEGTNNHGQWQKRYFIITEDLPLNTLNLPLPTPKTTLGN